MRISRLKNVLSHGAAGLQTEWKVTKAKRSRAKKVPDCEFCGKPKPTLMNHDQHHRIPVHVSYMLDRPALAWDENNLVTACRHCHWWWGHLRNWRNWNSAIFKTMEGLGAVERNVAKLMRDEDIRPEVTQ